MSMPEMIVVALAVVAGLVALTFGTLVDTSPAATSANDPHEVGTSPAAEASTEEGDAAEEPVAAEKEPARADGEVGTARYDQAQVEKLVEKVETEVKRSRSATSSFRIATLNILGSNHAGGGLSRAAREVGLLKSRGIQLVGLQEVQRDQRGVFISGLSNMQMWPQDALGRDGYRVQIMWRTDRFELVDSGGRSHTFNGIPSVPIPYVLLRDKNTGSQFWVIVSHHSPNGLQAQRDVSTRIQVDLVNELKATGHPVLLMGDFNEKATFFCEVARDAGMTAANGGGYSGGCTVPGGPLRIDWILGTAADVRFSGYHQDGTTKSTGMSDHYLIYADATITDRGTRTARRRD
ncbi:endonuclease/exonuclease/phosphatase family protein [Nocardioides vastitatis]|uniref:Endonuclease/exonuclease/phosphatase family protein n=2 Tax=Nocardioides vastitatis TaxID=2568655 RepID=A0ABW0ZGU9_9ACTN|nr:endonuclease/exonuclease/phosphatase family protein [Nocardioides sp.]